LIEQVYYKTIKQLMMNITTTGSKVDELPCNVAVFFLLKTSSSFFLTFPKKLQMPTHNQNHNYRLSVPLFLSLA